MARYEQGQKKRSTYPLWSILIAVYKEADSIGPLLANLNRLHWPATRLDLIFACESDDIETLQCLESLRSELNFRIVRIPKIGPRTKPKALQAALPFVRANFVSVYDAEDRPHPDQLRAAFQAFVSGDPKLAVVQAPLVVWNDKESWISSQFALDYAIWFRVMLPALSKLSGMLPLGGTSNHFRTTILREVGGWDPYNVTEDADLGVRLARSGFRADLISPPTFEEGVVRLESWIKQRGRWIQGHIQTIGFHSRHPLSLYKELGPLGLMAFTIGFVTGPFSGALVPTLWFSLLALHEVDQPPLALCLSLLAFPYIGQALLAARRDGRLHLIGAILTSPLYAMLQLPALARAVVRVLFTPSVWDKTDHGQTARPKGVASFCAGTQAGVKAF